MLEERWLEHGNLSSVSKLESKPLVNEPYHHFFWQAMWWDDLLLGLPCSWNTRSRRPSEGEKCVFYLHEIATVFMIPHGRSLEGMRSEYHFGTDGHRQLWTVVTSASSKSVYDKQANRCASTKQQNESPATSQLIFEYSEQHICIQLFKRCRFSFATDFELVAKKSPRCSLIVGTVSMYALMFSAANTHAMGRQWQARTTVGEWLEGGHLKFDQTLRLYVPETGIDYFCI